MGDWWQLWSFLKNRQKVLELVSRNLHDQYKSNFSVIRKLDQLELISRNRYDQLELLYSLLKIIWNSPHYILRIANQCHSQKLCTSTYCVVFTLSINIIQNIIFCIFSNTAKQSYSSSFFAHEMKSTLQRPLKGLFQNHKKGPTIEVLNYFFLSGQYSLSDRAQMQRLFI